MATNLFNVKNNFSVSVGAIVIGLSKISSFFSYCPFSNNAV